MLVYETTRRFSIKIIGPIVKIQTTSSLYFTKLSKHSLITLNCWSEKNFTHNFSIFQILCAKNLETIQEKKKKKKKFVVRFLAMDDFAFERK